MTKVNIKKTHGLCGGLMVVISFLFFIGLVSCTQHSEGTCKYKFESLATGRVSYDICTYSIKKNHTGYEFFYRNDKDSSIMKFKVDVATNELRILNESVIEDVASYVGEQTYLINGDELKVNCFRSNNEELIGPDLLVFCNETYGILIMKYTGFVRELIEFDLDNCGIDLVRKIKEDSLFYQYGGQKMELPSTMRNL